MSGFMDTSKYENKSSDKKPSFMDVSKYKFMDTSKYTKKEEQPKEKSFINKVGDFLLGTPKPLQAAINADNKGASLVKGFTDSTTLGLTEDETSRKLAQKHPLNYNAGKMIGYISPGSLITKGVEKVAQKTIGTAAKEVGKRVAVSSLTGGALTGTENAVAQTKRAVKGEQLKPTGDILKEVGINTAAGGLLDLGLMGLGKVGSKLGESAFKNTVEESKLGLKTSKLKGFTPKGLETKKLNDYYNNIDAQDYINSSDPKYIEAENKLRANKGLKPLGELSSKPLESNKLSTQVNTPSIKIKPLKLTTNAIKEVPIKEFNPTSIKDLPTPKAETKTSTDTKLSLKSKFKNKYDNLYTATVDKNNPLKKIGKNTYMLATNSTNSNGIVDNIVNRGLVNDKGIKIGKSLSELNELFPKGKEQDFERYMRHKLNVTRAAEGKPVYPDYTPEMSKKATEIYEKEHPDWKAKSNEITSWIDSFYKEWGVKKGLTSEETYNIMREANPNYIPTHREFSTLEGNHANTGGKGFIDQSSPIKKATGSSREIKPTMENILNMVNRTVKTAKYNEVGQSLLKEIRNNPSSLAEILPESEIVPNHIKNVVSVLENGKPVNIRINDQNLLNTLNNMTKNSGDIENAVKKVAGTYKALITQKNPLFAVRNLARDIPTYITNSTESNPIKATKNLLGAYKDILTNSDKLQQYQGLGGGSSNFVSSNNARNIVETLGKKPNILKQGLNKIEKFNSITETAPRLAEFNNVLKKTGDTQQALYAANDVTTNFARGGNVTKQVDSYVPYLNAGIQGLDKLARQFRYKPIPTIGKGLIAVTVPTIITDHINKDNPYYKELDNRTKDNYLLFPNVFGEKDDKGNAKTFIKIPKSRELGVLFGSLFERGIRKAKGEENSFKSFPNTVVTNFAPSNPIENNLLSPILNLKSNKDFANRDIVPRVMLDQNLSPKYQYDEKTSELAKALGKIPIPSINGETTNLSPKQVDYIIRSYTGVIGQLGLPATTKTTYTGQGGANILKPITTQFTSDPLYSNQTTTDFYDNLDKLKRKAADRNFVEKLPSKIKTKEEVIRGKFTKAQSKISDLNKQIKNSTDPEEIKSLRQKIIDIENQTNNLLK